MGYFEKIYRSDLSHRARAVYMYLRDRADSSGSCWPGINTIAVELGLSRSTVKRALAELCREKLIAKLPRQRSNGGCTSNLYRVGPSCGAILDRSPVLKISGRSPWRERPFLSS